MFTIQLICSHIIKLWYATFCWFREEGHKCCKIAPIFKIQLDVLLWRISVRQQRMKNRIENMKCDHHILRYNIATINF